jgi:hypothetical protein
MFKSLVSQLLTVVLKEPHPNDFIVAFSLFSESLEFCEQTAGDRYNSTACCFGCQRSDLNDAILKIDVIPLHLNQFTSTASRIKGRNQ